MDLDLDQLEALATAVSEGTFEAAARALHLTPSAVSQRVKALETAVGRILLVRSKPVRTTPSGQTLLRAARQIRTITAEANRELGGDDAAEPLTVALAANADSLATWLIAALASVGHPSMIFDVQRADETMTADLLRNGTVMGAVTSSAEAVPGCTTERLGRMRYVARASASFVERWFSEGVSGPALSQAPVVTFDRDDSLQDTYLRRHSRRRLDPPRHYVPGSEAFVQAVRAGLGWGMVPDLQVRSRDEGEELVEFDQDGGLDVSLYWQQWRLRSTSLDLVATAIRTAAASALA
jgi:LysR family transcriptional regulator (chromosome initiation inhibitor)